MFNLFRPSSPCTNLDISKAVDFQQIWIALGGFTNFRDARLTYYETRFLLDYTVPK